MKCREFEEHLCDYIDDALSFDVRRAVDEHLLGCRYCAELHAEAEFASQALRKAPAIEAPAELIADIIHGTIGYGGSNPLPAVVGGPTDEGFVARLLRPIFSPVLQPRFVMSMAMTMLSFSMLTYQAQNLWQRWHSGEISITESVASVERQVEKTWDGAVEFYDSVLMLYELQTRSFDREDGSSDEQ